MALSVDADRCRIRSPPSAPVLPIPRPTANLFVLSDINTREESMQNHIIMGVHVTERMKNAVDVQRLFTEYGCNIKTRLGLHEVNGTTCAQGGIVLLELVGDEKDCLALGDKLAEIPGIEVQKMVFGH
jgi:hypothetical protein